MILCGSKNRLKKWQNRLKFDIQLKLDQFTRLLDDFANDGKAIVANGLSADSTFNADSTRTGRDWMILIFFVRFWQWFSEIRLTFAYLLKI